MCSCPKGLSVTVITAIQTYGIWPLPRNFRVYAEFREIPRKHGNSAATAKFRGSARNSAARGKLWALVLTDLPQTERQTDRQTPMLTDLLQTDRQRDRQTGVFTDLPQTDKQTNRQSDQHLPSVMSNVTALKTTQITNSNHRDHPRRPPTSLPLKLHQLTAEGGRHQTAFKPTFQDKHTSNTQQFLQPLQASL